LKKQKKPVQSSFGKGDWKSFFRLIPYIRLPWLWIAIAFVVNLTYSEITAIVPVSTAALFGGEFTGKALASALIYNLLNYGLMFASLILTSWVSYVAVKKAQETLWKRMLKLDMAYYDTHNPSDLMSTLTNDTDTAVKSIISQLTSLIPALYYLYKVCVTLNSYDYRLLVSIFVLIPVEVIYVVVLGRWRYETNAGIYGQIGKLTAYLAERVSNVYLIRSFTNEKQEEENGLAAAKGLYHANVRAAKVSFAANIGGSVMELLQRGLPIIFGIYLLQRGAINMKQWIAFFLFIGQIISRVNDAIGLWTGIKSAQGSAARMVEIYTAPVENECGVKNNAQVKDGDIEFHDVTFAYGEKEVLHGINAVIPRGKTTALVGRSGCGKTTLMSLVERLYTPKQGSVTLAGVNVAEYNLEAYRDHFAYVQQDSGVFGGTLRSAMTYGIQREIVEEELTAAAEKTGILPLVQSFEAGFDAPLAVSGSSVSGGQRQRIVLTRELLKQKPVILLDEPTSALDAMSAVAIQEKILELFPDATKLMITHDLRLLARVEHVIFMENGCVLDSGTPEELMKRCEAYRELVLNDEEVTA